MAAALHHYADLLAPVTRTQSLSGASLLSLLKVPPLCLTFQVPFGSDFYLSAGLFCDMLCTSSGSFPHCTVGLLLQERCVSGLSMCISPTHVLLPRHELVASSLDTCPRVHASKFLTDACFNLFYACSPDGGQRMGGEQGRGRMG